MGGPSNLKFSSYEGLSASDASVLFLKRWLVAGAAMSTAELMTIPIDTAKVRLQLQGQTATAGSKPYTSMFNCLSRMAAEEGPRSLFKGLSPGVLRQMVYGGLRLGTYDNVRDFYAERIDGEDAKTASFAVKVASGFTTGAFAMCFGQPADLMKVRFQANTGGGTSLFGAARSIVTTDGFLGLWRGLGPNIMRNAVINTAELATYDQIKETIKAKGLMEEGVPLHVVGSVSAGFCAVVVGSPFDVVKTRIMNSVRAADGSVVYTSFGQTFGKIMSEEGPLAFYKGFLPNFMRLGSWVTVMFLSYEQYKKLTWDYIK